MFEKLYEMRQIAVDVLNINDYSYHFHNENRLNSFTFLSLRLHLLIGITHNKILSDLDYNPKDEIILKRPRSSV